jgi:hypothetical protein
MPVKKTGPFGARFFNGSYNKPKMTMPTKYTAISRDTVTPRAVLTSTSAGQSKARPILSGASEPPSHAVVNRNGRSSSVAGNYPRDPPTWCLVSVSKGLKIGDNSSEAQGYIREHAAVDAQAAQLGLGHRADSRRLSRGSDRTLP